MDNQLHFRALGLDVMVETNIHLHDDGVVDNLRNHLIWLGHAYNADVGSSVALDDGWNGQCQYFRYPSGETHYHIFYLQKCHETVFVRGHEEAHVLRYLGLTKPIGEAFQRRYGISLPLPVEEDDFADLGGMLALLKAGMRPSNAKNYIADKRMLDTFKRYEGYLDQIQSPFLLGFDIEGKIFVLANNP